MDIPVSVNPATRTGLWDERNLRWYLGSQLVSFCGTLLQSSVLSLLVIKLVPHNAPYWVGIVWALGFLPGAVLAPFAGVYVDRADKSLILKYTSVLGVIQALALALLTFSGLITVWQICLLSLLGGFVTVLDAPTRNAFIKDIVVHGHNVGPGSQAFSALWNVAQFVGPGLAGPLVLAVGYGSAFLINGLSFGGLLVAITKMHLGHLPPRELEPVHPWRQFRSGLAYTFGEPGIRLGILLSTIIGIFGFSFTVVLPVIAKEMFSGDYKQVYSYLGGSYGLGGLLGSVLVISLGKHFRTKWLVISGCALVGSCLLLLAQASTDGLPLATVLMFLAGLGYMFCFLSLRGVVMHLADRQFMGRVVGVALTFFFGSMMLGPMLAAALIENFGSPTFLIISGGGLLLIAMSTPILPGINQLEPKQEK